MFLQFSREEIHFKFKEHTELFRNLFTAQPNTQQRRMPIQAEQRALQNIHVYSTKNSEWQWKRGKSGFMHT